MRELFQIFPSALSDQQLADITAAAMLQPAQDGTIFSSADELKDMRRSSIRWLPDAWVRDLLWGYVRDANNANFHADVDNQADLQFTEYHADVGGHYDWHHDVQWNGQSGIDRKLSVTVQLSDPKTYDGGGIEFEEVQTSADFTQRGTILIFPSYLRHRVLPVTRGTRQSLVAWFTGPSWR